MAKKEKGTMYYIEQDPDTGRSVFDLETEKPVIVKVLPPTERTPEGSLDNGQRTRSKRILRHVG